MECDQFAFNCYQNKYFIIVIHTGRFFYSTEFLVITQCDNLAIVLYGIARIQLES